METGKALVDTHRIPDLSGLWHAIFNSSTDVRPRCLLHNTCKLPVETCKSIITTTVQEMGKVRLYNVYSLCRVVIDRTIVLHELCFEDCSSHCHPRYNNEYLMDLNLLSGLSQRDAASGFRGELLLGSSGIIMSTHYLPARKKFTAPPSRDCKDRSIVWTLYTADHLSYQDVLF